MNAARDARAAGGRSANSCRAGPSNSHRYTRQTPNWARISSRLIRCSAGCFGCPRPARGLTVLPVCRVDPRNDDPHENLASRRHRHLAVDHPKHLRAAVLSVNDSFANLDMESLFS
jgi:hypothetical protein